MKKQLLTLSTLFITYFASAQVGIGTTSPSEALDVETSDATKTAIDINNTSTGDPKINFQLNGTTNFSIGIDNSDSDKLKIVEVILEEDVVLSPKVSAMPQADGSIISMPLEDMSPLLSREVLRKEMIVPLHPASEKTDV